MSNTVQIVVSVQDRASSALSGITGALGNMASVAGGVISADILGRIGEGLAGLVTSGFDGARAIENATAKLNAFTKDADVSAGILAQLRDEAAKTPFAFEDMANAGTSLLPIANQLNVDLMSLIQTAEILAASNPAEGLAGAAFALKEAASGDFTSVIERFNLSRVAINDLKEQGVPNLEIISRALQDAGYDMSLVSNLSETFDGRLSTLKDNIGQVATAFATPIFDFFSEQLFGLGTTLEENLPNLKERAGQLGQLVADIPQTIIEAWSGDWVDSDVIQPIHRLAGTITLDLKAAWDGLQDAWQKGKDFWNDPWVQDKVITPLANLSTQIAEDFVKDFQKLDDEWRDLNAAGEAWNGLMKEGQELWSSIVRYAAVFGINLGEVNTNLGNVNIEMGKADTLGSELKTLFDNLASATDWYNDKLDHTIKLLQSIINWANSALERLNAVFTAFGQAQANGFQDAPANDPNVNSGGGIGGGGAAAGATVTGGSGGRGMFGRNVTVYATVNNQMDIHEMAYLVARQIQDNR